MRSPFYGLLLLTLIASCGDQPDETLDSTPSVVVLISLDQFRWDYFERFGPFFEEGGFRRFSDAGAVLTNVRYRHAATSTCPGHAAIATGTSGDLNGIVGNDWYDTERRRTTYCSEDTTATLLGREGPGRSPSLLMVDAVGDLLKRHRPGSKVFAVSGKDRSAIMLAGHEADAAYWLQDSVMITSTYYMDRLPGWVNAFNDRRLPQSKHGATWDRVLPAAAYDTTQGPDDFWNEEDFQALGKTFPHVITGGSDNYDWSYYEALRKSPFEDEILLEFIKEMIVREGIGRDEATDLLGIGFSTVDRIGHPYGPDSHEIMDIVIRTDRILAELFDFLDANIGLERVLVVLTADHGVQRFPELVADPDKGIWAGRVSSTKVLSDVSAILDAAFGPLPEPHNWVASYLYPHLYFNHDALAEKGVSTSDAADVISEGIASMPGYDAAIPSVGSHKSGTPEAFSIYPGRSGDVLLRLADNHISRNSEFGTTHGTPWDGDQHVPMLWVGPSVENVINAEPWNVVDLAPTLAVLIGIDQLETMDGRVIPAVIAGRAK